MTVEKKGRAEKKAENIDKKQAEKAPADVKPHPEENAASETERAEAPEKSETEIALEKAIASAEDFKRKWYAVTAEYENYRKRTSGESARRYAEGRADVIKGLFPIADNLDRALAACTDEGTKKGIEMVKTAFGKLLEQEKIEEIDPRGEPFDAQKHEAIMAVDPAEGEESGIVREVYLKGYEREGKVLRFAQVVVTR